MIELGAGADAGAQLGKALAMGAGAGAALGFNQAKPWPWVQVLNQANPRLWPGLRLELALVFTRKSPGPGCRC